MGYLHYNNKTLTLCIILSILLIGMSYSSHYLVQTISAKKSSSSEKASSTSTGSSSGNTTSIALNALELKNSTYRWQNTSKAINPTLRLDANTDYIIKIKNPTDTKHQLIIGSNGTEIAKGNEVAPGKTGKLTLPANLTGTVEYHCEYHPDTMKGIIEISGQ
jgi:cupredoxin-like protein